jgi:hypothetical protein
LLHILGLSLRLIVIYMELRLGLKAILFIGSMVLVISIRPRQVFSRDLIGRGLELLVTT